MVGSPLPPGLSTTAQSRESSRTESHLPSDRNSLGFRPQPGRIAAILRIDKESDGRRAIHREHSFSDLFVAHLLALNIRYEADLVDQLFNSSQKRLARILLLLAHFCKDDKT
jgi:hypothetical protein